MIRLAVLTGDNIATDTFTHIFHLVYRGSPSDPLQTVIRAVAAVDPEVILLDIGDWGRAATLVSKLRDARRPPALIGFRRSWTAGEQRTFEQSGITNLLSESFSSAELELAVYRAVHQRRPITHPNILVFLPAKAGSGCSTVTLNTAASLANSLNKRTLLVEADCRSGVLSILLNVENRDGFAQMLARPGALTEIEFRNQVASIGKLDLLLANPFRPGPSLSWADYYRLLLFVQENYDFIVVDLGEIIDSATSELVKAARTVFIVCEPEVASVRLGTVRRIELESCGIPPDKVCVPGNRWDPNRLKREHLVRTISAPMFAALPNDYQNIKNAALESRLVSRDSPFGKASADLARRLSGLPETPPDGPVSRMWRLILRSRRPQ